MKGISVFAAGLAAVLMTSGAWAITSNPQCVHDALATKQACKSTCDDNFSVARDLCRNVKHDCADACRAGRETCVAPVYAALQSCLDGCDATLDSSKTDCRTLYGQGTVDRDHCIDAAQIVAFMCRDTCRENLDRAALKLCRTNFRSCIKVCPPAN